LNIPFINKDKLTATNLCTSRKLYPFWDLNLFTQAVVYKNRTDQYKICHKQKNAPNRFEFSVFYCNTDSGSCLVVKGVYRRCYWCFQKTTSRAKLKDNKNQASKSSRVERNCIKRDCYKNCPFNINVKTTEVRL